MLEILGILVGYTGWWLATRVLIFYLIELEFLKGLNVPPEEMLWIPLMGDIIIIIAILLGTMNHSKGILQLPKRIAKHLADKTSKG